MMAQATLISPAYTTLQRELHARPKGYGGKGSKWAPAVARLAEDLGCSSILDYGCGQGSLVAALWSIVPDAVIRLDEYDPAIPGKDGPPSIADLVVCTDVLEHIEPDRLTRVLAHLQMLARKAVFVVIATRPSNKTMTDGRNAHLIVEDADWWRTTVEAAGFSVSPGPASPLKKPSREWVAVLTPGRTS
jgi:hypothetical protein